MGIILWIYTMGKTCAFLGNDCKWDMTDSLRNLVFQNIVNLINNEGVSLFYVGGRGAYEQLAYSEVLKAKKLYPNIKVYFVMSSRTDLYNHSRDFDDFIYPVKAELGYKRWCIVHRNNWIAENTDFLICYNKYEGRAFPFCRKAKNRGVKVIELADIIKKSEVIPENNVNFMEMK